MIDDEDEDDDEEEDEGEPDPDAPPSPSASPPPSPTLGSLKSRPTTLNLTTAVSQVNIDTILFVIEKKITQLFTYVNHLCLSSLPQDSLNNNSSVSPRKSSWQDSLRNPASQGDCCFHFTWLSYF